ncbi:hypothetical protein ACJIZ3_009754 [Penstemon smallii]|uniref:Uncharacterized protein n=1 Tax=Penstemon smallii TaxID=265156 RepID=A0ABD3TF72_9LAMI
MRRLVGTLNWNTNVISLLLGKLSKLSSKQNINLLLIFPGTPLFPQLKLCNNLTVHVDFIVKVADIANNGRGTALSDISIAAYNTNLSSNHYICGSHQAIGERMAASIQIYLAFSDRVIDINSWEKQSSIILHLIQPLDTSGSLLRNTNQSLLHLSVLLRVILQPIFNQTKHNLKFRVIRGSRVGQSTRLCILLLSLNTLMNQKSGITTIIHDQIGSTSRTPVEGTFGAPPVLLQCLSLPGEHSGAVAGDGGGGVVLGGENTGHFDFGQVQLETAEIGLGQVLDLVLPSGIWRGWWILRFGERLGCDLQLFKKLIFSAVTTPCYPFSNTVPRDVFNLQL